MSEKTEYGDLYGAWSDAKKTRIAAEEVMLMSMSTNMAEATTGVLGYSEALEAECAAIKKMANFLVTERCAEMKREVSDVRRKVNDECKGLLRVFYVVLIFGVLTLVFGVAAILSNNADNGGDEREERNKPDNELDDGARSAMVREFGAEFFNVGLNFGEREFHGRGGFFEPCRRPFS